MPLEFHAPVASKETDVALVEFQYTVYGVPYGPDSGTYQAYMVGGAGVVPTSVATVETEPPGPVAVNVVVAVPKNSIFALADPFAVGKTPDEFHAPVVT